MSVDSVTQFRNQSESKRPVNFCGEVFFVKIVFLEKRHDITRFEMIRIGTRGERKVYDVSQDR